MRRPGHDSGHPIGKRGPVRRGVGQLPGAAGDSDKAFRVLAILLLVAVTAAYANHFFNAFHFDDFHTIVNNTYVRSLCNIPRFFTDGRTFSALPTNQSYRPLVTTTLAIDYFFGKGNVFWFHLSTFLLFLLQGVVMFVLYFALFDRSQRGPANRFVALAAVAWYLLHPANAETINYVIARSDSLSTFFILLALVIWVCWDTGRRRHLYLLPLALSCLAKPIGGVFAPVLFLYIYLFEETLGTWGHRVRTSLKKAAPSFAASALLLAFIHKMDPPTWRAGGVSEFHYVITQPYVLLHYFLTFFAPFHLSADTDWTPLPSVLDLRFLAGILFLMALVAIAGFTAKRARLRPISFGLWWFLLTLLPTSLIPLAEVMNDHRLFLPYVGLVVSVCWSIQLAISGAIARFQPQRNALRILTAVILVVLAAYGCGTHVRNAVWHTELTLWKDVTIKSPHNGRGLMNYGLALMSRGDYGEAEKYFHKAMKFVPNYAYLYINLGIAKASTGKPVEAQNYFQKAIMLNPRLPDGYYWYADFLNKQKHFDEAIRFAKMALKLASADLHVRKLLMTIYFEEGQYSPLKELAKETLDIFPGDPQAIKYLTAAERQP
jgi:hypothetical protein